MRVAETLDAIEPAYNEASMEAEKCFGDGRVYVEKLIRNPRHVEFQILADKFGNVIHLGERNCSVQRRNQKMLEEAPDFALSKKMQISMKKDAVKAAKAAAH